MFNLAAIPEPLADKTMVEKYLNSGSYPAMDPGLVWRSKDKIGMKASLQMFSTAGWRGHG